MINYIITVMELNKNCRTPKICETCTECKNVKNVMIVMIVMIV